MLAANTVTLENLAQKLPQWRPDDQSHLYAVVDMGRLVDFTPYSLVLPFALMLTMESELSATVFALASHPWHRPGHVF